MTQQVFQFKITLLGIKPTIWRRIQLVDNCTFWDLHVAIQDAMGWLGYHLHQFEVMDGDFAEPQLIGIPSEDDEIGTVAGWDFKVKPYLAINPTFMYEYDFGDSWEHQIAWEGTFDKQPKQKYPICLDGRRACPPEDVGGVCGFQNFLEAIGDPLHGEHEHYLEWVGGHYDAAIFHPSNVHFQNAKTCLKELMES